MDAPLAIILAAGKSTRMNSDIPKVIHDVCGQPLIDYVLDAARAASVQRMVLVVGHQADVVQSAMSRHHDVEFALQSEQHGTGHAVMMCEAQLQAHDGPVLILAGDTPLLKADSLRGLVEELTRNDAACVIGTAVTDANQGLGRIVRDADGKFLRIVEEKDASVTEKAIREINTGCYAFDSQRLLSALSRLRPENRQAEYYLTDCPAILLGDGETVLAAEAFDIREAIGVNTRVQLAEVHAAIQHDTMTRLMIEGVTIIDPAQTTIDPRARIGRDTTIHPGTVITGPVTVEANCRIGPLVCLEGPLTIPAGSKVKPFTHRTPADQ